MPAKTKDEGKSKKAKDQTAKMLKMPNLANLPASEAIDKFLESEEFYVERALRVTCEVFEVFLVNHVKLKKEILVDNEIKEVFLNISHLYPFHQDMLATLTTLRFKGSGAIIKDFGKTLKQFIPFFKLYTQYVQKSREAQKTLVELKKKKKNFVQFLELNEAVAGVPLGELLLAPVTRLPQYLSFLGAVYEGMSDKNSDGATQLLNTISEIIKVTEGITSFLALEAARKQTVQIQEKVFNGTIAVVSPTRYVMCFGQLQKVYQDKSTLHSGTSKQYFVLFNDCLMFGYDGKARHVLMHLAVENMTDCKEYKHAFKIMDLRTLKTYLVRAPDEANKARWMDKLTAQILAWNKGDVRRFEGDPDQFEAELLKLKSKKKKEMAVMDKALSPEQIRAIMTQAGPTVHKPQPTPNNFIGLPGGPPAIGPPSIGPPPFGPPSIGPPPIGPPSMPPPSMAMGPPPIGPPSMAPPSIGPPPSGPPPPGLMSKIGPPAVAPPGAKGPPVPTAGKAGPPAPVIIWGTPTPPPYPMAEWPNAPVVQAPFPPPPLPIHLLKEPKGQAAVAAPTAGGGVAAGAKPTFVELLKGLDKGGGLKKVDLTVKRASLTESRDAATAIKASLEKTLASYRAAVEEEEEEVDEDGDFD